MTCKCISDLPERIKDHLNSLKEYKDKPVLKADFKDLVFSLEGGGMTMVLKTDIKLKVEGRKTPKTTTMTFTYCPFCGTKYQDD